MTAMMIVAKNIEPKPCREAEIPARIVAGDHRADAERPERPHPGIALQPPRFEIFLADLGIGDAGSARRSRRLSDPALID